MPHLVHKPPSCPICDSPDRKKIEQLIAQGTELTLVGEIFGFDQQTVTRHRNRHLRGVAVRSSTTDATVLLRDLGWGVEQAEIVIRWAMEKQAFAVAISAIKQHRDNLMAIAAISGAARQFDSRVVVPYWEKIKGVIMSVAEKHPEVGDDLMEAIGKVEEGR